MTLGGEPTLPSKTVALTFDDGPGPHTAALARMLRDENVPSTFFVLGENVDQYEDGLKACVECGHTIALHGFSHARFSTPEITIRELDECAAKIGPYLSKRRLFRPPFGAWPKNMPAPAGYEGPVGWHADGEDWRITFRTKTPGRLWRRLHPVSKCIKMILKHLAARGDSGIVVLHDYANKTEALAHHTSPEDIKILEITSHLIEKLRKRGVSFAAL